MKSYCNSLILLLSVNLLAVHSASSSCEYPPCNNGEEHTMCKYPESLDRTAPKCNSEEARAGLDDKYADVILDAHNRLRQRVALGEQSGQPGAANMRKLRWDTELQEIAQRFANECERDGLGHDRCRNLKDGTPVGQNSVNHQLILQGGANRTHLFYQMVQLWYDEESLMSPEGVERYTFDFKTGHYTQVVWAETDRIGCGYIEENKDNEYFQPVCMKCNYAVSGNLLGAPVYQVGKSCSACPAGTKCSSEYPGLCTTGDKPKTDDKPKRKPNNRDRGSGVAWRSSSLNTIAGVVVWKLFCKVYI